MKWILGAHTEVTRITGSWCNRFYKYLSLEHSKLLRENEYNYFFLEFSKRCFLQLIWSPIYSNKIDVPQFSIISLIFKLILTILSSGGFGLIQKYPNLLDFQFLQHFFQIFEDSSKLSNKEVLIRTFIFNIF